MDNNALGNIIKNSAVRAGIYAAWVLAGIGIGAAQIAFVDPDPQWLTTSFNVWSYLGLFVGSLAVANSQLSPVNVVPAGDVNIDAEELNLIAPEDEPKPEG